MVLNLFSNFFLNDLAIDLGTSNTRVFVRNKGIVCNEPSIVIVKDTIAQGKEVIAVGQKAKLMYGRTPSKVYAVSPIKEGVIADFELAEIMLRYFIKKIYKNYMLFKPRVIVSVPQGITEVEKRSVRESVENSGAREVYLIEEPMAAAIGAGLPIKEASGNMIINIGAGTTEVAVISLLGIVYTRSLRIGGNKMDQAIVQYIKRYFNLLIGESTAEKIKIEIGSAYPFDEERTMSIKGRDIIAGVPQEITLNSQEVREALLEPLAEIIQTVHIALERTPPELAADIIDKGIILTGGGALLSNIDKLLEEKVKLSFIIAENPLSCVALGIGSVLENIELLKMVTVD